METVGNSTPFHVVELGFNMSKCISPFTTMFTDYLGRKIRQVVPCGKCVYCLKNKRNDWSFRLQEQLRDSREAWFLTLTYDEDNIPVFNGHEYKRGKDVTMDEVGFKAILKKQDLQQFIKNIRECNRRYYNNDDMKYYAVGEYGTETRRPHYHIILFNCDTNVDIGKYWKKGYISIGKVEPASINYVTKYLINGKVIGDEFQLSSKNLGIGYYKRAGMYHKKNKDFSVSLNNGAKISMPRYYRDKIFSDSEKIEHLKEMTKDFDKQYLDYYKKYGKFPDRYPKYENVKNSAIKKSKKSIL